MLLIKSDDDLGKWMKEEKEMQVSGCSLGAECRSFCVFLGLEMFLID